MYKIESIDPAQIKEGEARAVEVLGDSSEPKSILLCRWQGELHAFENICSHDHAPLCNIDHDGKLETATINDGQIECPRHGARFDVTTGQAMCLPAIAPIETYGIRVSQGKIELDI
ncbi:MAG: Rieske 2Fe-2S domain-containing protein [Candidatus Melainabacteria bacterium]|jgi:3-phenylpropionate/trans-cinnamate dioxygenase ferredoxin component|nr:Rieske 2Fe-2S domain-containing protein [Candidatus Melainabacteria bacterium]MBX9671792.1 Rieske 2Fe-2S domain-containing protein [Candidatus Obscuribacterales bacterium]